MRALILAAGIGSRLNPAQGSLPKGLICIQGKPLLDRQFAVLEGCGVERICLVTGYRYELLERRYASRADFRFNPFFASSNNIVSFLLRRDWLVGELIVLYADLLYEPDIICAAMESSADVGMLVDRANVEDGHGLVRVSEGRVTHFTTDLSEVQDGARFIGVSRFSPKASCGMISAVEDAARAGKINDYYVVGIKSLWESGTPVEAIDVTGKRWLEVDSPADLAQRIRSGTIKDVWDLWHRVDGTTHRIPGVASRTHRPIGPPGAGRAW